MIHVYPLDRHFFNHWVRDKAETPVIQSIDGLKMVSIKLLLLILIVISCDRSWRWGGFNKSVKPWQKSA